MHLLHLPFSHLLRPPRSLSSSAEGSHPPARDRVVDFGRHRGRRLGSLPSSYLRWIASTLRARDSEPWARLADQVLLDPFYRDRLEWEHAARLLSGDALRASSSFPPSGGVSELLDVAERFGWDYDDREGWARVDFELLGTSFGGRIPRVRRGLGGGGKGGMLLEEEEKEKEEKEVVREKREERRERRRRAKREKQMEIAARKEAAAVVVVVVVVVEEDGSSISSSSSSTENSADGFVKEKKRERVVGKGDENLLGNNPFPGRGSLLNKIKKRQGELV